MSVKTVSRSHGRAATAAAAYRAGICIKDERTGEIHDYTRKQGIEHIELVFPIGVNLGREELWNAAEVAEKRINSTVAREYEIALPEELNNEQRVELAREFAQHIVKQYEVAADVCVHAPNRQGNQKNYHAHILTTTRRITPEGIKEKTRILDDKKTGEIENIRAEWTRLANRALERAGHKERIDHRTLEAQGITREPTQHIGVIATAMERRGIQTERGDLNRQQEIQQREEQGKKRAREQLRQWKHAKAEAARIAAQEKAKAEKDAAEELERKKQKALQEKAEQAQQQEKIKEVKRLFMEKARAIDPDTTLLKLNGMRDRFFVEWEKANSDQREVIEKEATEFVKIHKHERQKSRGMEFGR